MEGWRKEANITKKGWSLLKLHLSSDKNVSVILLLFFQGEGVQHHCSDVAAPSWEFPNKRKRKGDCQE